MRVAIITPGFSESEKDWCIPSLLNLVRVLSTRAEVEVFAIHYPHDRRKYKVYGACVHALGGRNVRSLKRILLLLRAVKTIAIEHRKNRFDVIHAMWAGEPGVIAFLAGRFLRVPVVVTLGGGELSGIREIGYGLQLPLISRLAVRFSLNRARKVTVASECMHQLCKDFISGSEEIEVIPFGIDPELFQLQMNHIDRTVKNILSVGSLRPVKGHSILLHAMVEIVSKLPNVQLTIVGVGPLEGDLKSMAEDLGISDKVTFAGSVEHHELPAYYARADVLALPSLHEGQGMVAVEALACGVPVVGTTVGILPDLPRDVCTTARPGDSKGLAECLLQVLNRADEREEVSASARRTVEEKYTIEKTVDKFLELYRQIS